MHYVMVSVEQAVAALTTPGQGYAREERKRGTGTDWWQEKERIRILLMEQLFSIRDRQQLRLLTDQYQCSITRMMDTLYQHKGLFTPGAAKTEEASLYRLLHELLYFLKVQYTPFFNFSRKVPRVITVRAKRTLKQYKDRLEGLLDAAELQELRPLLLAPFQEWLQAEALCFGDIRYAIFACQQLAAIAAAVPGSGTLTATRGILLSINFNAPDVVAFYINEMRRIAANETDITEKLRVLQLQLQTIRQETVFPGAALHPAQASLQQQLVLWLHAEIDFQQQVQVQQQQPAPVTAPGLQQKIHTSLSVPQLALLFRLLKEEKLITNTNQSELLKIVSSHFTTANKEQFSYGHLHGTFYKIEAHTRRTVYDLLIRLLHQSKKVG